MKIKVGEYVRTNEGIGKVLEIRESPKRYYICSNYENIAFEEDIITSNENILELVEAEDIINGYKILEIRKSTYQKDTFYVCIYKDTEKEIWQTYNKNNIKTILTNKQFEDNAYKVEE